MRYLYPLLLAVLLLIGSLGSANATTKQDFIDKARQDAESSLDEVRLYQAKLEAKDIEEWTDYEIELFLSASTWAVYRAMVAYKLAENELASNENQLIDGGYLSEWPANPFDEWKPMPLLGSEDRFIAGAFVLQLPPPEYYSLLGGPDNQQLVPLSFELGVYGPDVEFAKLGNAKPGPYNEEWAVVPEGTLYMLGSFRETAAQTIAKREKRKAASESN